MNVSLTNYIENFCKALDLEIKHSKEIGGTKYRISEGSFVAKVETAWIYTFELEVELGLPTATPVRIEADTVKCKGEVIACEGFEVTLALYQDLGKFIAYGNMYCEPWQLLVGLQDRLKETADTKFRRNSSLALKAISESRLQAEINAGTLKRGQKTALNTALSEPVTFIWGPPGTGKTHTLAYIALHHYKEGNRVLVISHSNIAVDGAIERIDERSKGKLKGKIIRYGYPKKPEVREKGYLTSFNLALTKHPALKAKKELLESQRNNLKARGNAGGKLVEIEKELASVKQEIRSHEAELVNSAEIVATSISKATVDKVIYNSDFDVVLMDEASMAYIPQAFFAATIAKRHVVYIGDFRQLAPIAQASGELVERWLKQDVFEYSKVKDCVEKRNYHPWMVLLDTQHRMHPRISGFVSTNIYGGLLKDGKEVKECRESISKLPPLSGQTIGLINLGLLPSFCSQDSSRSRYNLLSALVAVNLAMQACTDVDGDVAIITPYATQSRLIRAMLYDVYRHKPLSSANPVVASTVHQFQGSERDVVIFDCVDAPRQKRPGVLLTANTHDSALRLINVAVTRAKGKFILLAHRGFWESKLSLEAILAKLIRYLKEKGQYIAGNDLFPIIKDTYNITAPRLCEGSGYFSALKDEVSKAKSSVYIDVPDGIVKNPKELTEIIVLAKEKGLDIRIRAENPNILPEPIRNLAIQNSFAWSPITIIDRKTIWFGYPMLKMERVEYNPLIRFKGEKTAQTIVSLLGMSHRHISDNSKGEKRVSSGLAKFVSENIKCQKCKSLFHIAISSKGKPYLACSSCREKAFIPVEILNTYLMVNNKKCPHCGHGVIARVSKYGLYITCKGYYCHNKLSIEDI